MTLNPREFFATVLRGLAQVAFADSLRAGALVLTAIACISPWGAFGALLGAVVGTVVGLVLRSYPRGLWAIGLNGYNAAIVGILWGGLFASGVWDVLYFMLALLLCISLEELLRHALGYAQQPILSAPAVLTAYGIAALFEIRGDLFWVSQLALPLGPSGVAISIACVLAALATVSIRATIQVVVLSTVAAIVAGLAFSTDIPGLWGLWAFAVPPASFGIQAIFLADRPGSALAGAFAALASFVIWVAWVGSGFKSILPPLMFPFIIATWITLYLFRRLDQTQPES